MSNLMLDVDQAGELKAAFRRSNWTNQEIKQLCEGNTLAQFRQVLLGNASIIAMKEHIIASEEAVIPTAPTAWTVDDEGNIHFTLTSNGFTREQWEKHLECHGWRIGDYARQVLRRASEAPTNGVIYNIVVRPGKKISDSDRITKTIRAAADKKGWVKPHWEVACLIRDTFTDEQLEQMGLWYIVTMHEHIKDSGGGPGLLSSSRRGGGRWLNARYDRPDDDWYDRGGFAFTVSQVCSLS